MISDHWCIVCASFWSAHCLRRTLTSVLQDQSGSLFLIAIDRRSIVSPPSGGVDHRYKFNNIRDVKILLINTNLILSYVQSQDVLALLSYGPLYFNVLVLEPLRIEESICVCANPSEVRIVTTLPYARRYMSADSLMPPSHDANHILLIWGSNDALLTQNRPPRILNSSLLLSRLLWLPSKSRESTFLS